MLKKKWICLAVLMAALFFCLNVSADTQNDVRELEALLDEWFGQVYFTAALIETEDYRIDSRYGIDWNERVCLQGEPITDLSVRFVSGTPAMKDEVYSKPGRGNAQWVFFRPRNGIVPGEAKFHVSAVSENHTLEKDYTLRYMEFPADGFRHRGNELRLPAGVPITEYEALSQFMELPPELEGGCVMHGGLKFTDKADHNEYDFNGKALAEWLQYNPEPVDGEMLFWIGNTLIELFNIHAEPLPFRITGPSGVFPGDDVRYETDVIKAGTPLPEDFVLTAEGAELGPDGRLILKEDAQPGDRIVLTAVSEEADTTVRRVVEVLENPIPKLGWLEIPVKDLILSLPADLPKLGGFGWTALGPHEEALGAGVVLPEGTEDVLSGRVGGSLDGTWNSLQIHYDVFSFSKLPETAREAYDVIEKTEQQWIRNGYEEIGRFYVNRYPAICGYRTEEQPECPYRHLECVFQAGAYQVSLDFRVSVSERTGTPPVDRDFLYSVISRVKADGLPPVEIQEQEPAPAVTQAEGITETAGGAAVQYSGGDPDPFYGNVIWSVTDAAGEKTAAASVDKTGLVKASANVKETSVVRVRARYEYGNAETAAELTVRPAVKKISIAADDAFLYLESGHSLTLKAEAAPAGAKLSGTTWTVSKPELAEITDHGDGTATLSPLAPGAVTVTAADASGKKAAAKFTVTDKAVTAVEILMKGTAAPGKTVSLSAKLTPDKPARKDVVWSVNVDESIAVINAKGQLKISGDVPSGTVITVTCAALGAARPVDAALDVTVE